MRTVNQWTLAVLSVAVLGVGLGAQSKDGFREFTLSSKTIGTINGKVGYTITLSLPPEESLDEMSVGDDSTWRVEKIKSGHNVIQITPLKAGAETNFTLISAEGQVYTWNLREGVKGVVADQQLLAKSATTGPTTIKRQFIPVEACTEQTTAAAAEVTSLRAAMAESSRQFEDRLATRDVEVRQDYALSIRRYHVEPLNKAPYFVRNIWADQDATYIQLDAPELPAIWELLDGKPNLTNPIPMPGKNGKVTLYRIPKVIETGRISAGGAKPLTFQVAK